MNYISPLVLAVSMIGMALSLALGGILLQPDWALALLLANLLAHRGSWPWMIPGALAHDFLLHWTWLGVTPSFAVIPFFLAYSDAQVGAALPQRIAALAAGTLPLLWLSSGLGQWLLTVLLCVPLWYLLAHRYEQPA